MGLFDFFRKKVNSNPQPKRYPISTGTTDGVYFVCSLIKDQFALLEMAAKHIPPILYKERNQEPQINQWLAGYIFGFYDAFLQSRNEAYDPNALELIFSVFWGEEDAEESIKQCIIARLTLDDVNDNLFKIAFEEFETALYIGGNNFIDWKLKKINAPLGIYKKYI